MTRPGIRTNALLASLAVADFALLQPYLKPVTLKLRTPLETPNRKIDALYFLDSGIASVVAVGRPMQKGEIGLIGHEGVSGLPLILGDDRSPHAVYMQLAGAGQRIDAADMLAALERSTRMQKLFLRFAGSFMTQLGHTALANANAAIEQRLARWLLMAHDRVEGDEITLTHELLSLMIGTRRPGVTQAIRALVDRALITTKRGVIQLSDRPGLEAYAGAFYGVPEAEYERMIGFAPFAVPAVIAAA